MLLPQSQAYKTLSDRLATVSSLQMHLSYSKTSSNISKAKNNQNELEQFIN